MNTLHCTELSERCSGIQSNPSSKQKPSDTRLIKGIKRVLATRPRKPKAAFKLEHLRRAVELLGSASCGGREKTNAQVQRKLWLCTAFWTAERRKELRFATWRDVTSLTEGASSGSRRAKAINLVKDSRCRSSTVAVMMMNDAELCAPCQLQSWRALCEDAADGTLSLNSLVFRKIDEHDEITDDSLSFHKLTAFIKDAAESVALDPKSVACHSTRRGVLQMHADSGTPAHHLMELSRHAGLHSLQPYLLQSAAGVCSLILK